jgi:histone H3/H4
MRFANQFAIHAKRVTIMPIDFQLASQSVDSFKIKKVLSRKIIVL